MKRFDFIAIGGGSAGMSAAGLVRRAGRSAAVVDRGPVGGLCSLNGCNPKKALVRSTEALEEVRHAAEFGVDTGPARLDWSRVMERKESFTRPVTSGSEESLRHRGIELIQGEPRFVGRNTLEVNGERIEAGGILIATGSVPRPLSFPGADRVRTSNDLLAVRQVPERLFIIGAGVVAFELGQVFARAGSKVTMATPGGAALPAHDPGLVDAVIETSRGLGIQLLTSTTVRSAEARRSALEVLVESAGHEGRHEAEFVLNAAGRVPSLDSLDLAAANVERDGKGVVVDGFLRSPSNPSVFAAGDAHGRLQLSPIASYEGRIAARNFLEGNVEQVNYDAVPRVLFTIPPLASVGLTEPAARASGLQVEVTTSDMADWKVYAIAGQRTARAKVIAEAGSGRILGAHIYGKGADEMIHVFALAMRFGITARDLADVAYAYPTFSSNLAYTQG